MQEEGSKKKIVVIGGTGLIGSKGCAVRLASGGACFYLFAGKL